MSRSTFKDNPLSTRVSCPACFAAVGEPCTAPTAYSGSRRNVTWFHSSRTSRALEFIKHSTESSDNQAECSCGWNEPALSLEEARSLCAEHLQRVREGVGG